MTDFRPTNYHEGEVEIDGTAGAVVRTSSHLLFIMDNHGNGGTFYVEDIPNIIIALKKLEK